MKDFWSDHPFLDGIAALLVGAAVGFVVPPLEFMETDARAGLYGSASGVIALIGGLGTVALAAYTGSTGRRMLMLRKQQGRTVRRNIRWVLVSTSAAALLAWASPAIEAARPEVAWGAICTAVVWCGLTALRQAWLIGHLIAIADADATDEPLPAARPIPARSTKSVSRGRGKHTPEASGQLTL